MHQRLLGGVQLAAVVPLAAGALLAGATCGRLDPAGAKADRHRGALPPRADDQS